MRGRPDHSSGSLGSCEGGQAIPPEPITRRRAFAIVEEDWLILASLLEPRHLNDLPMRIAQRCLHLYKAGYLYTDAKGWVVASLHGKRELGKQRKTV